ncbi:MAG: ISAzo13-like element transposase-related protein [Methylobacter sp.]
MIDFEQSIYCSKYNPIEHRLFAHITRACQGVVFHSVHCQTVHGENEDLQGIESNRGYFDGDLYNGKKMQRKFP